MDTLRVRLGFIRGLTLLSRHHSPSLSIVDEFNFAIGLLVEKRIHPKLTPLTFFSVIYLAAERLQWDLALRTGQPEFRLVGH